MFDISNTLTFADKNGKTLMTLQTRVVQGTAAAPQYLNGMEAGWSQGLDKLAHYIWSSFDGNKSAPHPE